MKILIAEDEADLAEALQVFFRKKSIHGGRCSRRRGRVRLRVKRQLRRGHSRRDDAKSQRNRSLENASRRRSQRSRHDADRKNKCLLKGQ